MEYIDGIYNDKTCGCGHRLFIRTYFTKKFKVYNSNRHKNLKNIQYEICPQCKTKMLTEEHFVYVCHQIKFNPIAEQVTYDEAAEVLGCKIRR